VTDLSDAIQEKNRLLLELEGAKREQGNRRLVESLATNAAVLETRIVEWFRSHGRTEEAVVSLVSAASCLADAHRPSEVARLLGRARALTSLKKVQAWIEQEYAATFQRFMEDYRREEEALARAQRLAGAREMRERAARLADEYGWTELAKAIRAFPDEGESEEEVKRG